MRVHLDSFSGSAADLPNGKRTASDVLRALAVDPLVSTWDMEQQWLRNGIGDLKDKGLIEYDATQPYPWCRYTLTDAGRAVIAAATLSKDGGDRG